MRLLIRLLGPVDVVGDDGSVRHSGSALRRTLLSLLALHPGQVLASGWLMEHLWADDQPDSGLRALRFHVSQLRKEIGATVPIDTRPGGYGLGVSRAAVDALIFDDQARQARTEVDDEQAAAMCSAALGLWRGAPFGDAADCSTLEHEAARLEELRIAVIEHAHARRLAAGAGSELIADLSRLVKEHPLREGLWSSLILAEYRAGQQAEALRTYERLRANLAESLGLKPSPELQNLQLRVLQQDPGLLPVRTPETEADDGESLLPTGTVTFLLSDVEDSTAMWERAPGGMAVAIERHYALLDAAIAAHGGVRPVEQGEGDSVVGAFARASDAVVAAVDAQRRFGREPWPEDLDFRVRIAIHTGEGLLRGEGSYAGPALNRCARIRATGHGGQILVSSATAELVADRLPGGVQLLDLGRHRLKDLSRPERIWQVAHPDAPAEFPPLRSVDLVCHNLPEQLTPLVGRSAEIAETLGVVRAERLVTLTGSGGVGKTRLALAVAAQAVEAYPGGVWWVDLALVADPDAVGRAALTAAGGREVPGTPVVHQLAVALEGGSVLLVLDNCEHVVGDVAALVADVLMAIPHVRVLATSREPLGVPGEVTWRVPSLSFPSLNRALDVADLAGYDAVTLFLERARRVRPSVTLTDVDAIAQICRRLDGIPLALELAAGRCRQLSVQQVAAQLDDRFRLLTGGARIALARLQTLTTSVDWSFDLLDDTERRVFRRLGCFAGPFPLEAAESIVLSGGGVQQAETFDVVARLVDKSLVSVDDALPGAARYRLLETLRAYATQKAEEADELGTVRDAHAAWWSEWLEPRQAMPTDEDLDEIDEFHADLKAALDWVSTDLTRGLKLLNLVARPWLTSGHARDAINAADRLLDAPPADADADLWLETATNAARLYFDTLGPDACTAVFHRVRELADRVGDEYHVALANWGLEPGTAPEVIELVRARGDRYLEMELTLARAADIAEARPVDAAQLLDAAKRIAGISRNRELRENAVLAEVIAARTTGHLKHGLTLASDLLHGSLPSRSNEIVREVSLAGLLMRDEDALQLAASEAQRMERIVPGLARWARAARHRLDLLQGGPSIVFEDLLAEPGGFGALTRGSLWLLGREAIDAGAVDLAVDRARVLARSDQHGQAVLHTIQAAATQDRTQWLDALALALEQGLRLIAIDALEGLAVLAASGGDGATGTRLLAVADSLRAATGYRWRFPFEEAAVEAARSAAVDGTESVSTTTPVPGWEDIAAQLLGGR